MVGIVLHLFWEGFENCSTNMLIEKRNNFDGSGGRFDTLLVPEDITSEPRGRFYDFVYLIDDACGYQLFPEERRHHDSFRRSLSV